MSQHKNELRKKATLVNKSKPSKISYWKLFWGILTLLTIFLAILSRQWAGFKSIESNQELPKGNPSPSPLRQLMLKPGPLAKINTPHYKIFSDAYNMAIGALLRERGFFSHLQPKDGNPAIITLEQNHPDFPNSRGMYDPSRRQIGLYYQQTPYNAGDFLKTLRNEYFSYQVQLRNELNGITTNQNIVFPFLNVHGEIDHEKYRRYSEAIVQGYKTVFLVLALQIILEKLKRFEEKGEGGKFILPQFPLSLK